MSKKELTNLLPKSAIRSLRRGYFLRLATIAAVLVIILIIIHGILLIPTYLYVHSEVTREQSEFSGLTQRIEASNGSGAAARLTAVKTQITYLSRLQTLPTASGAIKGVLTVPHEGIHLTSFTFTAPINASSSPSMTISGNADTRDELRTYNFALGQLPYVSNANLPISAYAKESDIPFTITLSGTLTP